MSTPSIGHSVDGSRVVVVIPTYNERDNIERICTALLSLYPAIRIVIVDDNSPDGTGQLADQMTSRHPGQIEVLHRRAKEGLGRAYVAGFREALATGAALIGQMDADFSHPPDKLASLMGAIDRGADVAVGSRYVANGGTVGWAVHRRLISRWGGLYTRMILGIGIADPTAGFKVYRRDVLEHLDLPSLTSNGYVFQIETVYRALSSGYNVVEVPIIFVERALGTSKMSRFIVREAIVNVWKLRFAQRRRQRRRARQSSNR